MQRHDWGYLTIWEFRVKTGKEQQFEEAYGADGVWAQCFQRGEGYLGTELVRDQKQPGRYLTLDFWISRDAYTHFREQHFAEYEEIDKKCEALTEAEAQIGEFDRAGYANK